MSFPSLERSFRQSNSCTQTFIRRTPRYATQNSFSYLHIHLHRQRQELAGCPMRSSKDGWSCASAARRAHQQRELTDRQRTEIIVIETMHYFKHYGDLMQRVICASPFLGGCSTRPFHPPSRRRRPMPSPTCTRRCWSLAWRCCVGSVA